MTSKSKKKRKDAQIGWRITREQRERIDRVIEYIQEKNSRVGAVEIYDEFMSFKAPPEFVTQALRDYLSGASDVLTRSAAPVRKLKDGAG